MQNHELRPLQHLNAVSKQYPYAWKMVEEYRARRGKDLPDWPDWCFMPGGCWNNIGWGQHPPRTRLERLAQKQKISHLGSIGTWRYTQGIYRFDHDLMAALIDTELTGDLPCDVLYRLPEWSIYIETPGHSNGSLQVHGGWVHLDWGTQTGNTFLQIILDTELGLRPFSLVIGPWSLQEAQARLLAISEQEVKLAGITKDLRNNDIEQKQLNLIKLFLPMVLYICSENPDINSPNETKPRRPEPKKIKKGLRLFPPDKPTIWNIGETIGKVLRQTNADFSSTGSSPRAHIRRAHWHGYWTGNGEQKRFKYNWLSPILVSGKNVKQQDA